MDSQQSLKSVIIWIPTTSDEKPPVVHAFSTGWDRIFGSIGAGHGVRAPVDSLAWAQSLHPERPKDMSKAFLSNLYFWIFLG